MSITYRDAVPADAPLIARLYRTVFRDAFAHLYRPDNLDKFLSGVSLTDWEAQLADPAYAFRIAEADGTPAGYVKLGPLKLPVSSEGAAMLLEQLYVLKPHHGRGIGRVLMDWAVDAARMRGAKQLYLTVFTDNRRAKRLYELFGFEPAGRYDFRVGDQVDEDIIMLKQL